jgi:uncharacterized membrane protein YcjF (UPF0283 family)
MKARQLIKICEEIEGISLGEAERTMIKMVLTHNGVANADHMTDEVLLQSFAELVAEKIGANPEMGALLQFMTAAGVERESAAVFLGNLGY